MLVLRLFFMAIVFVPTVTYSEDRPYFWGTDLSEDYSYVELSSSQWKNLLKSDAEVVCTPTAVNISVVANHSTSVVVFVPAIAACSSSKNKSRHTLGSSTKWAQYTSNRSKGFLFKLKRELVGHSSSSWSSNNAGSNSASEHKSTYKTTGLGVNYRKNDLAFDFYLSNYAADSAINSYASESKTFAIEHQPNGLLTYTARIGGARSSNLYRQLPHYKEETKSSNLSISAKYDNDTKSNDLELFGSWSRSRDVVTTTNTTLPISAVTKNFWGSQVFLSGHALKRLGLFKTGLGFTGDFYKRDNNASELIKFKLISIYTRSP